MNCKNCNAVMKADVERKLFVCPYCESTEPFDGVSKDELQGMLHDAIRDVRKESIKEAKKQLEKQQAEKRTPAQKAFDSFVWVLQVIVCVILSIFSVAIFTEYVGLGVISLLQLILMIVGMVMKSKYRVFYRRSRARDRLVYLPHERRRIRTRGRREEDLADAGPRRNSA